MKKVLTIIFLTLLLLILPQKSAYAEEEEFVDITPIILDSLDDIDTSAWERFAKNKYFEAITNDTGGIKECIEKLVSGEISFDVTVLFETVFADFLATLNSHRSVAAILFALAVISVLIERFSKGIVKGTLAETSSYVIYCVAVIIIVQSFKDVIDIGIDCVNSISDFSGAVLPVLSALVTTIGGTASSSLMNPTVITVSALITELVKSVIIPLLTASFVLSIISGLCNYQFFLRLNNSARHLSEWIIGIMFTLFFGFISIQRLTASALDTLSVRTIKYTISSFSMYGGSFLSRSFDLVSSCAVVVKSLIGGVGMVVLISIAILPAIKLLAVSVVYRFLSLIISATGEDKINALLDSVGKIYGTMFLMIMTVCILFFTVFSVISVAGSAVLGL